MLKRIIALIRKDILLEFRQQHTFFGILLYIACTIFVLYLSLDEPSSTVWNALFWVVQLFVCVNAIAKSFLQETRGRMLYFYSIVSPFEFIISKMLYNVFLMVFMILISVFLFFTFFGNPVSNIPVFVGIVMLGGASLSLVF